MTELAPPKARPSGLQMEGHLGVSGGNPPVTACERVFFNSSENNPRAVSGMRSRALEWLSISERKWRAGENKTDNIYILDIIG